ncbi:MAG: 16S rRNA (guanine(966)-N(2))-methyltransferase RsmD [Deltaproteobacteria bacterium]|nr:16S rRNA (guanine(966)-N(2))-methyltransferase RsmD [Deltaproteobacteria bacterium]MBW2395045.1 16S rRNA (guanine(966)-N(2))-methyltransferase RsmD [Deltaproteobacteria bacterium]
MRVTGGELAGRRVEMPRRGEVRPTSDRVRESLFMRLGSQQGRRVLDLFAGSGALGIEALSRGADSVVFVDRNAVCGAAVRANLEALGLEERGKVVRSPAQAALRRFARRGDCFQLILVDPPYASGEAVEALQAIATSGLLDPAGTLVLETDRRHDPGSVDGLRRVDERRYGDTLLLWFTPDLESTHPGAEDPGNEGAA